MTERRQLILRSLLEEVGANGYRAASVESLLERTGLDRRAFEGSFSDKHACYLAAFDEQVERLDSLIVAAAAREALWRGKLRAGLAALLEQLDREPALGRALFVEVHAAGAGALERRTRAIRRAATFFDLATVEGGDAESRPKIASEGVVAGIHAVLHARLSAGVENGFRSLLPGFMYFAVLPYFGSEVAHAEMISARR